MYAYMYVIILAICFNKFTLCLSTILLIFLKAIKFFIDLKSEINLISSTKKNLTITNLNPNNTPNETDIKIQNTKLKGRDFFNELGTKLKQNLEP